MEVRQILETCVYVDDLAAAEQFYTQTLGLEVMSRVAGRHIFFRCGRSVFLVFYPEETSQPNGDVPTHGARGPGHVAFAIALAEVDAWRDYLVNRGVAIEAEITWPNEGRSLYFRDPAGNSVELATPKVWNIEENQVFG